MELTGAVMQLFGAWGISLLLCIFAVVALWKRNTKLQEECSQLALVASERSVAVAVELENVAGNVAHGEDRLTRHLERMEKRILEAVRKNVA